MKLYQKWRATVTYVDLMSMQQIIVLNAMKITAGDVRGLDGGGVGGKEGGGVWNYLISKNSAHYSLSLKFLLIL